MSDRTNDEKLRVLQERLAQIKQKSETPAPQEAIIEIEAPAPSPQREVVIETPEVKGPTIERKTLNLSWEKNKTLAIVFCSIMGIWMIAYGIFYGYTNIDVNSLISGFSSEEIVEENIPFKLIYDFELERSGVIAIIGSLEEEGSAKALVNDLVVKGFKCAYFFLPDNSNSKEKIYKVFIGPYENEEETNQWTKYYLRNSNSKNLDVEIIKL